MDDARYGESGSPEPLFRLAAALPEKKKEDDEEEEEEEEEEANRSGGIKWVTQCLPRAISEKNACAS